MISPYGPKIDHQCWESFGLAVRLSFLIFEAFGCRPLDVLLPELVLLTFDAESHLLVAEVYLLVTFGFGLLDMGEVLGFLVNVDKLSE